MSIYIKGLQMPQTCRECPLEQPNDSYNCAINGKSYSWGLTHRPHDCPLIEVPPHGRLINADALRASFKESIDECHKWANEVEGGEMYARVSQSLGTFVECALRVKAAPTVIPADPAEEEA